MFKHLFVPLDGSRLAEAVLAPARTIAARFGAAITLFHVLEESPPAQVHGEPHLRDVGSARAYLTEIAQALRQEGLTVDLHLHDQPDGDVARSITRHATHFGSDLIIVTTHGAGGVREMLFGSIAQQVIGHGPTPVLVLHPERGPAPFAVRRMLVPWDGKPGHASSVPVARKMAQALGAGLDFLTVVPRRTDLGGSTAGTVGRLLPTSTSAVLDQREEEALDQLAPLLRQCKADGLTVTRRVERGDPATVILQVAKATDTDLLVLSTHTKRGWSAFWSGSVAARVLSQWRRATLLVRAQP